MIRFACPGCQHTFNVGLEKAGKSGRCPKCQTQFLIPQPNSPEAEPPTADSPDAMFPPPQQTPPELPPPVVPRPRPQLDPNTAVEVAPCPGCKIRLSVLPADLGKEVECPTCKTIFAANLSDAPLPPPLEKTKTSALQKFGAGARADDDDDDDRPSKRKRSRQRDDDDDDDDDRPSRRRSRSRRRDDDDDYDDRRSGSSQKPGNVTAVGIMFLIGGIQACMIALGWAVGSAGICCLWPGTYYELVAGIMCIIRGANLLSERPRGPAPSGTAILQIICIINGDILNLILGIVSMSMLNNPEIQRYFSRRS